ncbi:MAG TPA: response regulator transcription factor [Stellaceae bacterium]|jgi:DNA-binding response OmpR family regulator|nr:response regulator transcription factor [Stellaceae bacterium]
MAPKIVLLGADGDFLAALAEQLALGEAFSPAIPHGMAETLADMVAEEDPDIVLLDLDAARGRDAVWDGLGLCHGLRARGVDVPMMVVSGPEEGRAAAALTAGASAHLAKPLRLMTLLAALRQLVQTDAQRRQATLTIGPYDFQPARKWLVESRTGRIIRLTEKETAMLDLLARAEGQAIARETLLEAVWGYNSGVTTHTLETHVYRLRQKIESDPANALLLITEPGGYRLG